MASQGGELSRCVLTTGQSVQATLHNALALCIHTWTLVVRLVRRSLRLGQPRWGGEQVYTDHESERARHTRHTSQCASEVTSINSGLVGMVSPERILHTALSPIRNNSQPQLDKLNPVILGAKPRQETHLTTLGCRMSQGWC